MPPSLAQTMISRAKVKSGEEGQEGRKKKERDRKEEVDFESVSLQEGARVQSQTGFCLEHSVN